MTEYFTEALVLDTEDAGELDKSIYLYTKELGKVVAKAKSIRKITSKLAGHLQPLNFVKIRLVEKNGFQITDALTIGRIKISQQALAILQFIKEMTFELQPDKNFWSIIKKTFQYRPLLKALGFAPDFARCNVCGSQLVVYFSKTEQVFLCRRCAFKIDKKELVLI
jgi:DNA repair protein RecO (recombination protein O)